MNRASSSTNAKKLPRSQSQSQPQPAANKERNVKRERFPANPLRGLSTRSSGSSSCSNVSGSESTSSEADQRFLLSHSFSSSTSTTSSSLGAFPPRCGSSTSNRPVKLVAKTPKSAPVVVSKPLIRKKPRALDAVKMKSTVSEKPNLQKSQRCNTNSTFGKRVTNKITVKPVLKKQPSVSREVKLKDRQTLIRVDDSIATPVSKIGNGSDGIYRSNGAGVECGRLSSNSNSSCRERTPPVQASVSPEILCGSSVSLSASAQSQACYAAGHLLSGVSDKRKCKPKGILTVGENGWEVGKGKILNSSDEFEEGDFGDNISVMPLPVDASEQWLLSPCDEEVELEKETFDDSFCHFPEIVECEGRETLSPVSDRSTSSDLCNISSGRSLSPMHVCKERVRRISSSLSPNELSRFRRFIHLSSGDDEGLAFDTTPSCERGPSEQLKDKRSPISVDTLGSENVIQTPESHSSFDIYLRLLSSPAEYQKKIDVGSELESLITTLQSTILSPRSQAPPQEPSSSSFNFDSLATSSDSIDLSQFQRGLVERRTRHTGTEFDMQDHKESAAPPGKVRELHPCSVAESMSTDGGSLICSEDSNWMACYKN